MKLVCFPKVIMKYVLWCHRGFFSDNSGKCMSHSPQRVCNKPILESNLYCPINEDLIYDLLIRLIKSLSIEKYLLLVRQ